MKNRAFVTLIALIALIALVGITAGGAYAQDADPLKSAACGAALQNLQDVTAAATPERRADPDKVAIARQQAALACLGRAGTTRERSGIAQPTLTVPPVTVSPTRPAPKAFAAALPAPPVAIERPAVITTCDPAGCWDSNGRRLNHMGPLLVGPQGLCTAQGGLVNCP